MRAFQSQAIARNPTLVDFGALSSPYLGTPCTFEDLGRTIRDTGALGLKSARDLYITV